MLIREILTEMPAVWTRTPSNAYLLNGGTGQFGNMLGYGTEKAIYPSNADKFNTSQERDQALAQVEQKTGKINWVNPAARAGAGAFIVRSMSNETGKQYYFGKYLKHTGNVQRHQHAKENDLTRWDANDFESLGYFNSQGNRAARLGKEHLVVAAREAIKRNDWTIYAQALRAAPVAGDKSAEKTNQSYLPVDVLSTTDNVTSTTVVQQIAERYSASNPDLVAATQAVVSGSSAPWTSPTSIGRSQFARDFCEILQPLAVIGGSVAISTQPIDFKGASVTYNTSRSGGLYDSKIKLTDGTEYLISSKKGGGTRSSVAGIRDALGEYVKNNPRAQQQYADEISALDIISTSEIKPTPGNIGVLQVGINIGILTAEDADVISRFDRTSPREFHASGKANPIPKGTPESVIKLIKQTSPSPSHGPSPYYQALNTVMKEVGDYFNNNPKMNELLNKVFASAGLIFISTTDNGKQFSFARKSAIIELKLGESYLPFEAKKRLAFQVS